MVCGELGASFCRTSEAVRTPAVFCGANCSLMLQLAPGATAVQVLPARAKSPSAAPEMVALKTLSGALPELDSVTVCTSLTVPTRCSPKSTEVLFRVATGPVPAAMPVPNRLTLNGFCAVVPTVDDTVMLSVPATAETGEYVTSRSHSPSEGSVTPRHGRAPFPTT